MGRCRFLGSWRQGHPHGANGPVGLLDVHRRTILETRKKRIGRTFAGSPVEAVASVEEHWVDVALAVGQEILTLQTLLGGALMVSAMLLVEWPSRRSKAL